MENSLRSKLKDIPESYEYKITELTAAYGEAMLENKRLVFCSKTYTSLVKGFGLSHEFTTAYTPQQNGMVTTNSDHYDKHVYHHCFKALDMRENAR